MLKKAKFVRLISVVSALALLVCAVYVPVSLTASAANGTPSNVKTFDFTAAECSSTFMSTNVLKQAENDGRSVVTNKPQGNTTSASGNIVLNDGTNPYTLTVGHTYKVDITFRVVSAISTDSGIVSNASSSFYLGYGSKTSQTNFVYIAKFYKGSTTFESEQLTGVKSYPIGADSEWQTMTYVFTMPDVKAGAATDLSLRYWGYKGASTVIDKVVVEDYGENSDYIATTNSITGEDAYYVGTVGETPVLKDLEKFGTRNFIGWYLDKKGTQKANNLSYGDGTHQVFGMFDGATEITVHDSVNGNTVVSGQQEDSLTDALATLNPQEFDGEKKFIGYYLDEKYTQKLTETTFGVANYDIYALYSEKVKLTYHDTRNKTTDSVEGYPQEALTLPDLRDGTVAATDANAQLFTGWYTDSKLTALFESDEFPTTSYDLYSKWVAKYDDITQTFDGKYRDVGTTSKKNFAVTAGKGVNDTKAAYYSGTEKSSYIIITNDDDKNKTLQKGALYKFSYQYKVKTDADMKLQIMESTSVNNYWENPNEITSYAIEVPAGADTDWVTFEAYFMVNDYVLSDGVSRTPKGLYVRAYNESEGNIEVAVDNVKFEAVSPVKTLVSFVCLNDDVYETEGEIINDINVIDSPIAFPNVTYGERELLGWTLTKGSTELYTGTLHGKENITLYAVWDTSNDPIVETFENYSATSTAKDVFAKSKEKANRGNYSMKMLFSEEIAAAHSSTLSSISYSFRGPQLQNNTSYRVSFKYYIETLDTNVTFKMATSTAGNIWDDAKNISYTGGIKVSTTDAKGVWLEGETLITTNFNSRTATNGTVIIGEYIYLYAGVDAAKNICLYIDDLTCTPISGNNAAILFDDNLGGAGSVAFGKVGETITFPSNPESFGKEFDYWATTKTGETRFTGTTFTSGMTTVYAKYNQAAVVKFDFENYGLVSYYPKQFLNTYEPQSVYDGVSKLSGKSADASIPKEYRTVSTASTDTRYLERDFALSGTHVIEVNRDPEKSPTGIVNTGPRFFFAEGSKPFIIDTNYNYVLKFNYYIATSPTNNATISPIIANSTNIWSGGTACETKNRYTIVSSEETGVWKTGYICFDFDTNTGKIKTNNENDLSKYAIGMVMSSGTNGDFYFDDIELIRVPKDKAVIAIKTDGCTSIPNYITVTPGTDYKSLLPQNPTKPGYLFRGYIYNSLDIEDWKAPDYGMTISTKWIRTTVSQGFEEDYLKMAGTYAGYSIMDFDYELYDSQASGNSKDNVASGRYSLHRKGTSMYFENACLLNNASLSSTDRYRVTMKIKMGKYLQTDGAVKVVSCKSSIYPWDTSGSYYAVAAIKDLTDGEWHEVSYVFNSVEAFAAIQTPGYCEIFIDDVKFEYVGEGVETSIPPVYDEYVPVERDADGNIIGEVAQKTLDISKIIDDSLCAANTNGGGLSATWIIIIIAAAVVVLGGGTVLTIVLVKKKQAKKA